MTRNHGYLVLIALFSLLIASCNVQGVIIDSFEGAVTVDDGSFLQFEFDMEIGDRLVFSITSVNGPVDILLMNQTHFDIYKATLKYGVSGGLFYIKSSSFFNVTNIDSDYRTILPGKYFLIIDNTRQPTFGAYANCPVNVEYDIGHDINEWTPMVILKAVGTGTFAVVVLIGLDHTIWKTRKFRSVEATPFHESGVVIRRVVTLRIIHKKRK